MNGLREFFLLNGYFTDFHKYAVYHKIVFVFCDCKVNTSLNFSCNLKIADIYTKLVFRVYEFKFN